MKRVYDINGFDNKIIMEIKKIFTESPEKEQWKFLSKYIYRNNIIKYLDEKGIKNPDDLLIERISGPILQAKEYFIASEKSSLQISSLLLYYGFVNLLYGIANLTLGTVINIKNHGMKVIIPPNNNRIADIKIRPSDPNNGALSGFSKIYSNNCQLCNTGDWKILDILGSIPDLRKDFIECYENEASHVIPVEIVIEKDSTLERIKTIDMERYSNNKTVLSAIEGLAKNYIIQYASPQIKNIVLRKKISGEEIGIYSLSGRKYLQISHLKNSKLLNPSIIILMFMALFSLGYVCRYRPEIWNPFVRNDSTGERLLIEKFLYICRRLLPNLLLSFLFNARIIFVPETQGVLDRSGVITKQEIEEIAHQEIKKILNRERLK